MRNYSEKSKRVKVGQSWDDALKSLVTEGGKLSVTIDLDRDAKIYLAGLTIAGVLLTKYL